jgi:cytochrome d ubiquinol oxidase subunit II
MINHVIIFIWAAIIGFAIMMYVLLDGFDLGIGILFPWFEKKEYRDTMMNSIAPIWDGNETWLVFGGASLYGAFPIVYGTLLPILYLPLMVMLSALIFRGVAFEFRFKSDKSRVLWDFAFGLGSITAAFCQGLILGTFVYGYTSGQAPGHYFVWFTSFSVMTGIAVVCAYALLGSTWLIMKTKNELQRTMFHTAKILLLGTTIFIGIVSLWTPFTSDELFMRWFSFPNFLYLLPLPILTGLVILYATYALHKGFESAPFVMSICLFLFCFIGFGISMWPYLIPRSVTIWQAAADQKTLIFFLIGAVILLPILISYTAHSYYVFKGKELSGYHE